jgi:hypothetical protein
MSDRYYLSQQRSGKTFGHINTLVGIVFSGEHNGNVYVALNPSGRELLPPDKDTLELFPYGWTVEALTAEEMSELLTFSDNPDYLDAVTKIFHRKARHEISGFVQQQIWVRDGCKCVYCGKKMGEAQLSIDHFVPLELGGKNDPTNYLSACRKCNKLKGAMHPQDWCALKGYDYGYFVGYLARV